LVERSVNSKSKNKHEEKEKLAAELERSLEVVKVKAAHKQIEDIEKSRKRPVALSICKRIEAFLTIYMHTIDVLNKSEYSQQQLQMTESAISIANQIEQLYNSISYDFQKSLDIGEEAMKKMFPVMVVSKDTFGHFGTDLLNIFTQLSQMKSYCERLIG
jgi:RecJ-like exonuclease